MMKLSVVVPCYNEEKTVGEFYKEVTPVLTEITHDYEIIFVNDGSKDQTLPLIKTLASADEKVKVISFSKNFGQQAAILAGLKASRGDAVIPMDCDLQDPVDVLPKLVEKWQDGYLVVHARRLKRDGETKFKKATAKAFYRFLNKVSETEIPEDTGDFKLLDRKVVDIVTSLKERNKYLRGLESWVGFKQGFVDFERKERFAGKTNYTLKKMLKLSADGILSNSSYPLKLFLRLGIALSVVSVLGLIACLVLQITLPHFNPVWWILAVNGLIGGLLACQKGFSDMYLYRVYEDEKARPEFIIEETVNL